MKSNTKTNHQIIANNVNQLLIEQWWRHLSPAKKALAQQLARMMDEVTEEKRIEIRKEAGAIKGRFIHMLEKPQPGSLAALAFTPQPAGRFN